MIVAVMTIFLVSGQLVGGIIGSMLAGGLALLLFGCLYWFSDRFILRMSQVCQLQPNDLPWLFDLVADLARRAQLPMPDLYVMESPTPNAFATGRTPGHGAVAVTTGITQLLTRDELAGVIAHELAHIKRRDTLLSAAVATLAGMLTMVTLAGWWSVSLLSGQYPRDTQDDEQQTHDHAAGHAGNNQHGSRLNDVLLVLVAPLAATLVQLGSSRFCEYEADKVGASILGDPLPLASALEKIEWAAQQMPMRSNPGMASLYFINPLSSKSSVLRLFRTHPPTAQRVTRLRSLAQQEGTTVRDRYIASKERADQHSLLQRDA